MTALQIRNLPDDVHRKLKARAAERGQSLTEYVTAVLRKDAETPTIAELTARIKARGQAGTVNTEDVVALIRRDRESH